mgnify:CR=1 FL=1
MTQTSGVANASRLRPGVCCLRHLACLSPRRRFNLANLRLNLACILPGYARHSAAQRPASSFVSPISFIGGELRERASARDLPRSRLRYVSAAYPLRHCTPRRRRPHASAPPDLRPAQVPPPRPCARRRHRRHLTALLRGSTRPRASAAPMTLRRPTPCRLPCPYVPLLRPRRCGGPDSATSPDLPMRRCRARPRRCGGPDTDYGAPRHTCYSAAPTPRLHASPRFHSL